MRRLFTEEIEQFIHDHVKEHQNIELTKMINDKFQTNFNVNQIREYKYNHNLKCDKRYNPKKGSMLFTPSMEDFIKDNVKGVFSTELTDMLNNKFGTNFKASQIRTYKQKNRLTSGINSEFKKGNIPHNKGKKGAYSKGCEKGWFKNGNIPANIKPVGSERITKDGYIEIKVAEPKLWKLKQRYIWEKHNGPIPEKHVVIFLDNNRTNCDINNLALISNAQLKIMNSKGLRYDNAEVTKTGVLIAKLIDAKNNRLK